MQYYLWARIKNCRLPIGAKVDQGILSEFLGFKVTDKMMAQMIDDGAIRPKPYPAPTEYPGSPRQYFLDSIAQAAGDNMDRMMSVLALAEMESEMDSKRPAVIGAESASGAVLEPASGPSPDATKVMTPAV